MPASPHRVHGRDEAPGWDHHDIWIDHTDGDRMAVAHDGGVSISRNRGASWFKIQLPLAQMYPRDGGHRHSLQRAREPAGRPLHPGAEPGVHRRVLRQRHSPGDVARGRRGRERLRDSRSGGSEHRLVERFRRRRRRRDRGPLRRAHPAIPPARGVAGKHPRLAGRRSPLPLPVGLPATDLAARPEHRLCRQPACAPDHQRRPELGGSQPRPDHQ